MWKFALKLALLLGLASCLATRLSYATIPYTFTNGTVADADEVNADFTYFENKFSTTSGHDHDSSDSKLLTTLGVIGAGEWRGSVVGLAYGGTGLTGYASGDMVYATSDNALSRLPRPVGLGSILLFGSTKSEPEWLEPGTSGYILQTKGSGANPVWSIPAQTKIITFTRDISLTTDQAVTGCGFKPTSLTILSNVANGNSIGFSDSVLGQGLVHFFNLTAVTQYGYELSYALITVVDNTIYNKGAILSYDNDGFTIDWTKVGSPTGTANIICRCERQ